VDFWLTWIDEDVEQTVEVARLAEAAGYRGIALADHVAVPASFISSHPSGGPTPFDHRTDFPDPLITAAMILAATDHLEVMTYVYVLPMRDPFSVANQVASLATFAPGRFQFGVGAGWLREEIDLLGHTVTARGRRMDEMIEVIRGFWSEEAFAYHGEFFDFGPTGIAPRPPLPVPIWIGGKSPSALTRAARNDGWLGMNYDLEEAYSLLEALEAARQETHPQEPFETFLIPNAPPSRALFDDLSARGVSSTVGAAWGYADRTFASLDSKREAISRFSDRFIQP